MTGVVFLRNTKRIRSLVEYWVEPVDALPEGAGRPDQVSLKRAIRRSTIPGFAFPDGVFMRRWAPNDPKFAGKPDPIISTSRWSKTGRLCEA